MHRCPIPTKVPCGHFWSHLLVAKGGKTASSRKICRPQACTDALRKARKKWRRRRERPERVCDKRSLSCPLSERRRRHPRLFAVLGLLVLLGQAKSTKGTQSVWVCGAEAPRGPKSPPAEALLWRALRRLRPALLPKSFLLFLSKKEPKKTARRKWSGIRRTPR